MIMCHIILICDQRGINYKIHFKILYSYDKFTLKVENLNINWINNGLKFFEKAKEFVTNMLYSIVETPKYYS